MSNSIEISDDITSSLSNRTDTKTPKKLLKTKQFDYTFKIVIIGDAGVGKTSVIQQFVNRKFDKRYEETIGVEFQVKTFKINDTITKIEIWDTAGSERFASITKNYYRGAQGVLIVYDVTNKSSFDKVESWYNEIKNCTNQDEIAILLIGNKCDLDDLRTISNNMLVNLGKNLGIGVMETSAKEFVNINEAFYLLIKEIYSKISKNLGNSMFKNDIKEGMILNVENTKKNEKGGCCGKKNNK